jgi:predicted cupin superfamily sugar epimerase
MGKINYTGTATIFIPWYLIDMQDAAYWIQRLQLMPHPEGGFYKETYRSKEVIPTEALASKSFTGPRNVCTAIYFLLRSKDRSAFHRIKSDELWHFHTGNSLLIYSLSDQHGLHIHRLGLNAEAGDMPQVVIPANAWFGAQVENTGDFALVSCTVAPGFDFSDFEMGDRTTLMNTFPDCVDLIFSLT